MMTQSTGPATRIAVLTSRRGVGASSRFNQPIQSESTGRASRNVVLMELPRRWAFDDRDRRRAHAEKILVRIFDFDPNWKTLRDANPVELAFHVGHARGRQIDLSFGLHRPSDALHLSTEALVRRRREINDRFAPGSHVSNLRFAKICDDVPFARVKQREDGNPGGYMGAG